MFDFSIYLENLDAFNISGENDPQEASENPLQSSRNRTSPVTDQKEPHAKVAVPEQRLSLHDQENGQSKGKGTGACLSKINEEVKSHSDPQHAGGGAIDWDRSADFSPAECVSAPSLNRPCASQSVPTALSPAPPSKHSASFVSPIQSPTVQSLKDRLRNSNEQNNRALKEVADLRGKLKQLKHELRQALSGREKAANSLQQALGEHQRLTDERQVEREQLSQTQLLLENALEEAKEAKKENSKLQAEVNSLRQEVEILQANLQGINEKSLTRETLTTLSDHLLNKLQMMVHEEKAHRRCCVVCLELDASVLFLPCKHLKCCENCARDLQTCPICRSEILDRIIPF